MDFQHHFLNLLQHLFAGFPSLLKKGIGRFGDTIFLSKTAVSEATQPENQAGQGERVLRRWIVEFHRSLSGV
ncbi:MAG: hypothetical protein NTY98_21760 [Verrucomicrobia bacterium]|nr:hypothetical protein [Verrucomicrobiota bacterium]